MDRRRAAGALLALAACIACSSAAPMASNHTALDMYEGTKEGCYYNFQHYGEGDRIMTNEPCLNCTCHNRMLMCYLRVCPFTKAIGQDCTVEKRADQCCPIVTCPDVPVDLLTSTSTSSPAEYGATGIGKQDKYGCSINGRYFPEGSKVPPTPNKPCEHCYCIRNMTTCVMQECTLHVDGCIPIYHKDVCCPVRYSCDHPEDEIPLLDDMTTTVRPTPGFLLTTTTLEPVTQASQDCVHDDQIFADGALLKTEKACEHCYCMKGDIVCVVQGCGTPMENEGKNCTSLPPRHGQCCPDTYICESNELATDHITELTTSEIFETTSSTPPRRGGVEGSGYRIEPDEPYTDMPIFDVTETEGSGEDQSVIAFDESETVTTGSQTPDLTDEMFLTTAKMPEAKPFTSTIEPYIEQTSIPILSSEHKKPEISGAEQTTLYESKTATESSKQDTSVEDGQVTDSENKEMKTTIIIRDEKVNYIATESSKPDISAEEEQATDSQNKKMETPISTQDEKITEDLSITTKSTSDYVSSSLSDSFISKDDQYIITTEPTLRKDDFDVITEVTTQKELKEITTEKEYYGQKGSTNDDHETIIDTTTSPQNNYHKLETAGAHDIENSFQTEQTTTKISLDISTKPGSDKDFKESTNEYISFSTIKSDFDETTSINSIENEIEEDLSVLVSHGRIPGEGDCLLNGITYKNNTTVPSTNKCQTSCRCVSSIVKCDPIICSPPPEYENIMSNCQPVYDQAESCCPTYICDQSKETILPEVHSQMSGTDNPRPAIANECNGNECKETVDKQTPPSKQHEPCTSENCVDVVREKQPDCGENGCENAEKDPILPIKHTEACANGKCDQATAIKPCESGDCVTQNGNTADVQSVTTDEKSCENGICTTDISLENQVDDVEKECENGNCRRKGTSEVAMKLPSTYNTENTLIDSITESLVSKDTTTNIKEFSSAIDSEFTTTKPDTKTDSVLEQETDNYDTSSQKIDITMQEITTKYPEHLSDITELDLKIELENFTSMKPKVEIITEEAVEQVSTSQNAISEKEYLTTPSSHILPEPALAEANAESDQKQANTSADENTTLNEQSKTPSLEYHLTTISDLIETPKLPTTSTLEYTISDHEKDLSLTETQNEITTPQNRDTDSQITETYDTKPLVKQDEKDKEYYDKDVTTTNVLLFDSEYTTETSVSKNEYTEPNLSEKMSTKLPESNEYVDKTTDGTLIYTTKNIVELVETTKQPIDNIDTQTEGKTSTEVSSVLTTPIHREGTTENNEEQELPHHVSTEQTVEYTMEEKSTTTTPEIQKYKTKEQQATETPESYLTKEITSATKETNAEEYFTELPITTTKETENDLMESLNGRGTELPVSVDVDEKQSELSPSHETDLYITTSGIEPGSEETQTEILKPIDKESTSQNTLDENISTSMPERFETETAKIVTDIPTLIITEPVKTDTGLSVVSQEKDNNEGISTVIMFDKITTQIPEIFEHHLFDKKIDEVNEIEPIHEITTKPDLFSTEQVEGQANIQIDSESHTHGLTTQRLHIIQTDKDMQTTQYKEYNTPVYETDFSTPKTYPKVEDNIQIYTEKSIDITKQAEQQGSDEVYNTITPTEISDVLMLTTSKKDLSISATTMLPETSSENTQHTLVLKEEEEVTESSTPQVTEGVSIKVSPLETFNKSTTPPDSEDKTTKLQLAEESVTDVPEITTKGILKIEDVEKTTPHITDITFSHDVINKVEEDIYSKVTTMSNAPITDKPTPGYSEIVTQDDSKSPDSYDTKATTDISEMLSSHMVTESEIIDDLHITVINEQEEKTTKVPANDQQIFTEATEIITEDNDLTLQDKDNTTVVSDLSIPPKSELSESQVYKASEAPSTQNNIKTAEIPNLSSDEQHTITEESEQTSLTTPVASIQLEDNINKIEETTVKVITELPEKATETEDNEQVKDILVATEKLEYDTEKISASPADEYIEKVTETSGQAYTGGIIAESPGKTTEFAGKDIIYSTVAPQQEVTVFKEIVTEVNDVHETLATITPDIKITEGMHLVESETEGASGLSKFDKEIFTEIPPQGGTEKLATPTLETSTKQLPESLTVNNEERSTPAGEAATVIVYTELPQLVTDNIRDSENIHKDQKLTEVPENTATTPSKLPEDIEKEKEVTNIHYQDKTTETPEKYTFESTTLISEHHDVAITTEKSFNVPDESSSYIETTTDNKNDRLSEEKYATSFTEIPETLLSKPADIDKNKISIETLLIDSTTKSPVSFPDTSITKTTESAVGEDKNDLSENFMPNTSFEFTNVTGKPDQGKTVTAVPDLHATQHSVSDVPDVATESIWTAKYETTPKTDLDEITSDEDKVKVSTSSEDKISTDTTEKYTKSSEETFTEIHKDSLVTDHDIFTTEKSKITDEPFTHENYAAFTTTTESPKTHLEELETKLSAFSSTESHLSGSTEELHTSDGDIDITKAPEGNQYSTESYAIDTHISPEQTIDQETIRTESPATLITSSDGSQDSHVEAINLPKETNITELDLSTKSNVGVSVEITTESNVLETKPIDETSKLPEYPKETSKPKYEYAESTPYFVELEEHTHKSIQETEATPEVYHEEKTSTLSSEVQFTVKEQIEITTSKQIIIDQEKVTEDLINETELSTKADQEKTTPGTDLGGLDIFHSTSAEQSIPTERVTTPTKHTPIPYNEETSTYIPIVATTIYNKQETPKYDERVTTISEKEKENSKVTNKPHDFETTLHETSAPEKEEFIPAVSKFTTIKITEDVTTLSPIQFDNVTKLDEKPIEAVQSTPHPELPKPSFNEVLPTDDLLPTDEDNNFPPTGTSGYGQEPDYIEEDQAFGPGTCRYGGKAYISAQQIPRDDPCDFCFCFRSDIICLQQSCPPPIHGCHEEPIQGFCCPRYECPVSMATTLNVTTTTTTTTTTLPPHFLPHAYKGAAQRRGCQIKGHTYKVGEVVRASSGPCLHCTCGGDGQMKCDPKACTPEPMLRQMIAAAVSAKRRR
ncbi:unnamed protein product [Parnassius apollo]|uniref:(apollo) hypothetical protein n=1 Tax=Parnassius apollo TaxID=110799 RepID=A0A8S3WTA1_PARAO|nr:unnamed protein product [Parnassius apollo]